MIPKRFLELEHTWLVQDNTHRARYKKGPLFKDELDLFNEYRQLKLAIEQIRVFLKDQPHTPIAVTLMKLRERTTGSKTVTQED